MCDDFNTAKAMAVLF
ncbi:DALR domain-containing protein [Acinetobacter baumannii]